MISFGPKAKVRVFETMELMRKYDFARSTAVPDESRMFKSPVAARDWTSSNGMEVVLLKAMAGVTQVGILSSLVKPNPKSMDDRPYASA